jgi:hypothetical protein
MINTVNTNCVKSVCCAAVFSQCLENTSQLSS